MATQWEDQYRLFFWMFMLEEDIVIPSKPLLYKRCVDDTYIRRKKNETDELYNALKSYHQNIKPTLKLDPTKFLDTENI